MRNDAAPAERVNGFWSPEDEFKPPTEDHSCSEEIPRLRLIEGNPQFKITDEPREVLQRIHHADGLIAADGTFKPQIGQFELIQAALEGNRDALELISEHNGLRQWVEEWTGSDEARHVLSEVLQIVANPDPDSSEVDTVELVLSEDSQERSVILPQSTDASSGRQRHRRLLERLHPRPS